MKRYFEDKTILVLLLILVIQFFPCLFLGKTLFYRDLSVQDLPFTTYVVNLIKQGEFPLWNPDLFAGFPQFASIQPPVLYPFFIFFLLFSFSSALTITLIIHYFIMGYGVYLIGKYWDFESKICLIGAIIFSLNGYIFEINNFQYIVYALAWLPYIFLYFEKCLSSTSKPKDFYLLVLFCSLMLSTGRLDYFYFTALYLFIWFIFKYFFIGKKEELFQNKRNVFLIALAVLVAVLLNLVQILPSFENLKNSYRADTMTAEVASYWSLHPLQILHFLFNNLFGSIFVKPALTALFTSDNDTNVFIYNLYLSTFAVISISFSFFIKDKKVLSLNLLGLLFILISLGSYTPVFKLFYNFFPGFSLLRYPIKILAFSIFSASLVSMLALDNIIRFNRMKAFFKFQLYAFATILFLSLITYFSNSYLVSLLNERFRGLGFVVNNIYFIFSSITFTLLILGLLILLTFYFLKEKINLEKYLIFLTIIIVYELLNSNLSNLWLVEHNELYKTPELVNDIKSLAGDKLSLNYFVSDSEGTFFTNPEDSTPMVLRDFKSKYDSLAFNYALIYGIKNLFGYSPTVPKNFHKIFNSIIGEYRNVKVEDYKKYEALKLMGVRFYLWNMNNKERVVPSMDRYSLIKTYPWGLQLWELKDYSSRFTFKNKVIYKTDENEIAKVLIGMENKELNLNNVVFILDEGKGYEKINNSSISIFKEPKFNIKVDNEINDKLDLTVTNEDEGYLIFANGYDKNWKAYDNKVEIPIIKANYYQYALKLAKGTHEIKLRYRPFSFFIGFIVSLLTLFLFIAFIINKKLFPHKKVEV